MNISRFRPLFVRIKPTTTWQKTNLNAFNPLQIYFKEKQVWLRNGKEKTIENMCEQKPSDMRSETSTYTHAH